MYIKFEKPCSKLPTLSSTASPESKDKPVPGSQKFIYCFTKPIGPCLIFLLYTQCLEKVLLAKPPSPSPPAVSTSFAITPTPNSCPRSISSCLTRALRSLHSCKTKSSEASPDSSSQCLDTSACPISWAREASQVLPEGLCRLGPPMLTHSLSSLPWTSAVCPFSSPRSKWLPPNPLSWKNVLASVMQTSRERRLERPVQQKSHHSPFVVRV